MDPVSVAAASLSASRALYGIIGDLTAFVKATKQIDNAIRSLEALGLGLAGVLANLSKALKEPVLSNPANAHLFGSIHDAVGSCESSISELETLLRPIQGAGSSVVQQAWRAHQLGLQQSDIDRLTAAMRTHSINLQLALQTVNVIITASIPGAIVSEQAARFDRLEQMLITVQRGLETNDQSRIDGSRYLAIEGSGAENFFSIKLDRNTTKLYTTAASVISSSVSRASRASRIATSEAMMESKHEPVFEVFPLEEPNYGPSSSEYGSPLNPTQRVEITNWIHRNPTVSTRGTGRDVERPMSPGDEDENDELEFRITSSLLKKGDQLFNEGDKSQAREHLARGLALATTLTAVQQNTLQLTEKRLLCALSCTDGEHFKEAESNFHAVIDASASEESAYYYCRAMVGLAALDLRARKLDAAVTHSRQAIRATQRAFGTQHPIYFESIRILALGYWARGDKIEARAYCETLPDNEKIREQEYVTLLTTTYKLPERSSLPQANPRVQESYHAHNIGQATSNYDAYSVTNSIETLTIGPSESIAGSERPLVSRKISQPTTATLSTRSPDPVAQAMDIISRLQRGGPRAADDRFLTTTVRQIKNHRWYEDGTRAGHGIYHASTNGNITLLKILLQVPGAEVNSQRSSTYITHCTPIMAAAMRGFARSCDLLLRSGADPGISYKDQLPLSAAISGNHYAVVILLINHDPLLVNKLPSATKDDLFDLIIRNGDARTYDWLLSLGPDFRPSRQMIYPPSTLDS